MSSMSTYWHELSLRLREGLEKEKVCLAIFLILVYMADFCLRTAEDLNATSKKLQRYEALLNEIVPMVPPDVRAMIEEVRQHVDKPSTLI